MATHKKIYSLDLNVSESESEIKESNSYNDENPYFYISDDGSLITPSNSDSGDKCDLKLSEQECKQIHNIATELPSNSEYDGHLINSDDEIFSDTGISSDKGENNKMEFAWQDATTSEEDVISSKDEDYEIARCQPKKMGKSPIDREKFVCDICGITCKEFARLNPGCKPLMPHRNPSNPTEE